MKPIVKQVAISLAVVGALASVVAGREQPSVPSMVEPVARVDTRLHVDIDLAKLQERNDDGAKLDAFAPRNFSPVIPPQAQVQAPPQKPVAPPLPFRYLGRMQDGDKLEVFLANGEESLAVSQGERVGDYRLDRITESELRFTYLPLKTRQTLPL